MRYFFIKKLFKAVFIITAFTLSTRILGFILRIYLANEIGGEALGIYQVGFSLFIVLATLVGSGMPLAVSKLTAKYRTNNQIDEESSAVSASLIIGVLVSILICIFIYLFQDMIGLLLTNKDSVNILLALAPAIIATAIFSSFRGSLWGQKNHFAVSLTEFIEQIFRTIICVALIELSILQLSGAMAASLALTIGCFISAFIAGLFYFKSGGRFKTPKQHYKKILKSAAPITGVRVCASLIQPLVAVIIPLRLVAVGYTSSQALNQLGTLVGMTLPLLFLPITIIGSLSTALIPELSGLIEEKNEIEIKKQISTSLIFSLAVSCLIVPIYIGLGPQIGKFLFNSTSSGIYLQSAAWIMVPVSLSNISASILNALGLEIKSFKNYLIGSFILIVSIWFLPQYIGIEALIIGMGLCMTIITSLNLRMINLKLKVKHSLLKPILLMACFIIPSSLLANFSSNLFNYLFPKFISLGLSAGLGTLMFILLCIVFELINLDALFVSIKNKKVLKTKTTTKTV